MIFVPLLLVFIGFSVGVPTPEFQNRNVITVPPNCPPGQEWILGKCRDVWRQYKAVLKENDPSDAYRNVVTVPPNCPPGQEYINGKCRDVWLFMKPTTPVQRSAGNPNLEFRNRRQVDGEEDSLEIAELNNRNIINIPNQCPIGYKPDALGRCREILK